MVSLLYLLSGVAADRCAPSAPVLMDVFVSTGGCPAALDERLQMPVNFLNFL
jgi:hypothetical protein